MSPPMTAPKTSCRAHPTSCPQGTGQTTAADFYILCRGNRTHRRRSRIPIVVITSNLATNLTSKQRSLILTSVQKPASKSHFHLVPHFLLLARLRIFIGSIQGTNHKSRVLAALKRPSAAFSACPELLESDLSALRTCICPQKNKTSIWPSPREGSASTGR